ncbi:MAG: hypothetical protein SGPRY_011932, partial [Prymnesium sp.]
MPFIFLCLAALPALTSVSECEFDANGTTFSSYSGLPVPGSAPTDVDLNEAPQPPPPPAAPLPVEVHQDTEECTRWAKAGECSSNPAFMLKACEESCKIFGPKDKYEDKQACVRWASHGECEANPSFMFESCEASCAHAGARKKAYSERCPPVDVPDALQPGQLTPLFARAVNNFPELSPRLASDSPYIAVFESFASPEEVNAFIQFGQGKYSRSHVLDTDQKGGVEHNIRTSSNTWCESRECQDNEHVRAVTERVANVTGIPHVNSEFAQLLEYKACEHKDAKDC